MLLFTLTACGGSVAAEPSEPSPSRDGGAGGATQDAGHTGTTADASDAPDASSVPKPDAAIAAHPPAHHRPDATPCPSERAPVLTQSPPGVSDCGTDADCTNGKNGRCEIVEDDSTRICTYDDCLADSDCKVGFACACGTTNASGTRVQKNACQRGTCVVDTDCGDRGFCSPSFDAPGCSDVPLGYFCHTPLDECMDDRDCPQAVPCSFDAQRKRWACNHENCSG